MQEGIYISVLTLNKALSVLAVFGLAECARSTHKDRSSLDIMHSVRTDATAGFVYSSFLAESRQTFSPFVSVGQAEVLSKEF